MASSDLLVQALMGSQMNQDPALAAALPRLQMAQALMQEGTNTAPVGSKWAGIGRVAQALLGGYMQNQSMSGIQDIVNQRNADTTNQMQYLRGGPPGGVAPAPQASTAPSGGFAGQLGASEGGGNSAVVNPAGYSGQYQFGAARLADPGVGVYKPAQGENLGANQWAGTFNIPGFPEVKTHADFLANPAAQKAAFDIHLADIDKNIAGMPGAANQDQNGLRAVAHLGGVEGMKRFVQTGGLYDPADANGTRLSDYYKKFAGAGTGTGVAGRTGGTDVAGPAAPTAPGGQPTGQAGGAAPQQYTRQQALDMIQRSIDVMSNPRNQYNPALMKGAQAQMELAKTLLGLDTYQQQPGGFQKNMNTGKIEAPPAPLSNYVDTPTGERDTTRTHPANYMPTPRMTTDASGNVIAVGPGGQPSTIAPNPSGFTGQTPEANAMRTMAVIGPKMANGTATPQEIANYHVAVSAFQNPQPVSINPGQAPGMFQRPLPAGMPVPGAAPSQGQSQAPTPMVPPSYGVPGPQPPLSGLSAPSPLASSTSAPSATAPITGASGGTTSGQPLSYMPSARAKIWENMANQDAQTVQKDQEKAAAGLPTLGTTATIRSMLPDVTTGKAADAKLLVSQWAAAAGMSPDQTEKYFGTNPVMGELLQKKLFELSTGAVRGMGAREPGSVISMFQRNYPQMGSRDMTIDAMTRLLDMDQIRNQDYASAKQQYHNESINTLSEDKGYRGLSGFDTQFDKTHSPRVYSAAALAAGGLPFKTWTSGLTNEQQVQAARLATSVYPDAQIMNRDGNRHGLIGPGGGGG